MDINREENDDSQMHHDCNEDSSNDSTGAQKGISKDNHNNQKDDHSKEQFFANNENGTSKNEATTSTSNEEDKLIDNRKDTNPCRNYLAVEKISKRKLNVHLSLSFDTGTISNRLVNAVSSNRLAHISEHSSPKREPEETDMQKFQKEKIRLAHAKEKKAARTMAVIVSTFIICWLPFFVMYVLGPLIGYPSPKVRHISFSVLKEFQKFTQVFFLANITDSHNFNAF